MKLTDDAYTYIVIECTDIGVYYKQGCYIFNSTKTNWTDQRSHCQFLKVIIYILYQLHKGNVTFLQADLSSIEDLDENNVIYDLIKTDSVSWIGGQRDKTNWGWSDGLAWNWENWHTGEPNNAGGK